MARRRRLRSLLTWFRDSQSPRLRHQSPDLYPLRQPQRPHNPGNLDDSADRVIHQEPTGRPVFAEHERDHHITTSGRRSLRRAQFALPPGAEERRRGIKGRLPIDTRKRARNALARASMMHNDGTISARELAEVRRAVHRAWPSIDVATKNAKSR